MARRRSGKKIDFVHWTLASAAGSAQAAGQSAILMSPALHEPETLLRIRGSAQAFIDGAQAPGGHIQFGMGIIMVPEGSGSTVTWGPITDSDAPWVWVEYFSLAYEELVTDVVDIPVMTAYRSVIDNKAMRIVRNQEMQAVVENVTLATALSVNWAINARVLSGS